MIAREQLFCVFTYYQTRLQGENYFVQSWIANLLLRGDNLYALICTVIRAYEGTIYSCASGLSCFRYLPIAKLLICCKGKIYSCASGLLCFRYLLIAKLLFCCEGTIYSCASGLLCFRYFPIAKLLICC